jgi:competence protein ComEA
MAYVLTENVMIWVKPIGEQSSGTGGITIEGTGIVPDATSGGESDGIVMVNINTADAATLATLPGVGPATAADILGYRAKSGDFGKIEDIMKVPGIKDSKYQKIKDFICI